MSILVWKLGWKQQFDLIVMDWRAGRCRATGTTDWIGSMERPARGGLVPVRYCYLFRALA
jgi:hypothetical protein